jgi:tetratricopeptide (TPR) repeat protein
MRFTRKFIIFAGMSMAGLFLLSAPSDAFVFQDRITLSRSLAHYAMGQMYDLLGLPNRAVLEYEKAAQFDEASYLIHLRLGANYARLDLLEKAENELKLVQKFQPDDLQSRYLLALIYSTQKKYDQAASEYEYILKSFSQVEPKNVEIYGYLGQLYYSQKKYKEAIEQFEIIRQLEDDNPDVLYLLGSLYLEIKSQDKAIELLEKAIEIDPEHDGSLNTLGYILAESGKDLDRAEDLISRALVVSPDNGAYLDSLGWVHYQKGQYEEALKLFIRADKFLKDPVIYDHLGDTYYKMGQYDEAIEYWGKSLELQPDQAVVSEKIENLKRLQARQTIK